MTWSWKTGVVEFKDRCQACSKPLRQQPGPYVTYMGGDYHVGCLLDSLCERAHNTLDVNFDVWPPG